MRAVEAVAAEVGMEVSRVTIDLLKPVPKVPLEVVTSYVRRGRRMTVVDVSVARPGDASAVCAGRAVMLVSDTGASNFSTEQREAPGPEQADPVEFMSADRHGEMPFGFHFSLEVRWLPAERVAWVRSPLRFERDRPMSTLERCAAMADFASVISLQMESAASGSPDTSSTATMMNVDTTINLIRRPAGEWFGFSDPALVDVAGRGVTTVALHDTAGPLGRVTQTTISTSQTR